MVSTALRRKEDERVMGWGMGVGDGLDVKQEGNKLNACWVGGMRVVSKIAV